MATKNKRIIVKEAELVDNAEVELTDLLSSSSKAEKAILDLADKCLAFNNDVLRKMALQLKARAAAVTEKISELGVSGVGGDSDQDIDSSSMDTHDIDSSNMSNEGDKQRLDMPEAAPIMESAKDRYLKRKQLKEADLELEADDNSADEELDKEQQVIKNNTFDKPSIKDKGDGVTVPTADDGKLIIDLSEPFEQVLKGLDEPEFEQFKSNVISHLETVIDDVEQRKDSSVADEYTKTIEGLSAARSVDDFDMGLDHLYDFADQHDILVETVKRK